MTRFAPSPTGLLHAGNYRTALFAYLFARQNKGKFILRIEDTDAARSKKEYENNIVESLKWLGLEYDEFYRQSDRKDTYRKYIEQLIAADKAYISKETPKEPGGRTEVIRFRNPNKKVVFDDQIRGKIEFDTTELGDFVIARSIEEPVFHLVVVVDDNESGVTHILRGEDHISNTPRHLLLYEALGLPAPIYAHIPLLLSPDRSKLSKRKGALPITAYRDQGYTKEALINYMALLGWNPGGQEEIYGLEELIRIFDLSRVQKSGAIFDEGKLKWMNKHYIGKMSAKDFIAGSEKFFDISKLSENIVALIKERVSTFKDVADLLNPGGEFYFITKVPDCSTTTFKQSVTWKEDKDSSVAKSHLSKILELLKSSELEKKWNKDTVKSAVWPYAEASGKGSVLWPMRYSLSGQDRSPDPFLISEILGREETLRRITSAYDSI